MPVEKGLHSHEPIVNIESIRQTIESTWQDGSRWMLGADGFHADAFITVVLVILISRLKHVHCRDLWSAALVNGIGVFLHEVAHFMVALFLGGRPVRFSVWPKRTASGYLFGSVTCTRINPFNALPIGLAPLALFPLAWWIDQHFFVYFPANPINHLVYVFLLVIVIDNALPSVVDWHMARRHPLGVLGWVGLMVGVWVMMTR